MGSDTDKSNPSAEQPSPSPENPLSPAASSSPSPPPPGASASDETTVQSPDTPTPAPEPSTSTPTTPSPSTDSPASKSDVSSTPSDHASHSDQPPPVPPKPGAPSTPVPRRRPKPPAKGILKPPPPPAKPTLGNRLRDMVVGSVTGETAGGPGGPAHGGPHNGAVSTLSALSGRLGLGFSRFANKDDQQPPQQARPPARVSSLPSSPPPPVTERARDKQPLKRAAFVLPSISITYPIRAQQEPWSAQVLEDRDKIEARQRMLLSTASGAEYWTSMRLIKLYESACRGREEKPRLGIVRALQAIPASPHPRLIHLILHDTPNEPHPHPAPYPLEITLNRYAAEALADVLTVEWGLGQLRLERGVLETEEALKPILHALLVSGTLPSLSLAGNKKIKAGGWRLVSVFLKRAHSLKFIDLSDTTWDRKGIEYLVQALSSAPVQSPTRNGRHTGERQDDDDDSDSDSESSTLYSPFLPPAPLLKGGEDKNLPSTVQTLRMDNCYLRSLALEALAQGVRSSVLKNISLRRNRIGPLGAVAIAVMIRDYPDTTAMSLLAPFAASNTDGHYTPRLRRGTPEVQLPNEDSSLPPIPLVVSSSAGGVTSRVVPEGYRPPPAPRHPLVMPGGGYSAMQDGAGLSLSSTSVEGKLTAAEHGVASLALQRSVRALDGVERIGSLLTLDLKSNDIRNGVTYIAQVLKRNRTLKVLNLSDNKLEPAGLVSLAEALKYNSTLETLDISSNPCCGPTLEGIAALRTSFTVNNSLKRLFLSDTGLTTEGAIDLAEFLPENRALLHLDLTANPLIGTAGILAVASGLKSNRIIRCLDVSIPPNDPNLAELSQSILQSCVRNTEIAAAAIKEKEGKAARAQRGHEAIWAPIKKSALVRQVKAADAARAQREREKVAHSVQGQAREYVYRLRPEALLPAAEETARGLKHWYDAGRAARSSPTAVWESAQMPKDGFRLLVERARALTERIAETVAAATAAEAEANSPPPREGTPIVSVSGDESPTPEPVAAVADPARFERLLEVNDMLTAHIAASNDFKPPPRILLPSQIAFATPAAPVVTTQNLTPRRRRSASLEISSPNFSIGDSDAESDAEELDVRAVPKIVTSRAGDDERRGGSGAARNGEGGSGSEGGERGEARPRPTLHGLGLGTLSPPVGKLVSPAEDTTQNKFTLAADRMVDAELAQGLAHAAEGPGSPVERTSRAWVEEEGEVFRKGTRLGVVDSDSDADSDADAHLKTGEQLRREIMQTEVPRSPPRQVREPLEDECDDGNEGQGEAGDTETSDTKTRD